MNELVFLAFEEFVDENMSDCQQALDGRRGLLIIALTPIKAILCLSVFGDGKVVILVYVTRAVAPLSLGRVSLVLVKGRLRRPCGLQQ